MARSRVELFEAIRRDRRVECFSIRELAERHGALGLMIHLGLLGQRAVGVDPYGRRCCHAELQNLLVGPRLTVARPQAAEGRASASVRIAA
jgi:hypothetical protein